MGSEPRLGIYVGTAKDVSCPGDNITYEVTLLTGKVAALECIPELSYFRGGMPPWRVEGTWAFEDDEVVITITKQDCTGPRKDTDIPLAWRDDFLVFRGSSLRWTQPPPEKDPLVALQELLAKRASETEAELAQLREQREKLEQQEAAQQAQQAELERLREEVRRQKEEAAQRAEALDQQRALWDEQRREAEASRAAEEEALRKELEEVQRQRSEVEEQRAEDEKLRAAQADLLSHRDRELHSRAQLLSVTEQALLQERMHVHHAKSQLAVVQSHVLSMLGSKIDGPAGKDAIVQRSSLDDDEIETTDGPAGDGVDDSQPNRGVDVYEVDWATVQGDQVTDHVEPSQWS